MDYTLFNTGYLPPLPLWRSNVVDFGTSAKCRQLRLKNKGKKRK